MTGNAQAMPNTGIGTTKEFKMNPLFIYFIGNDKYVVGDINDKPPEGALLIASIDPKGWFKSYLNASLKDREEILRGITI